MRIIESACCLLALLLLLGTHAADATWSIVAVDPDTGEVGGAVATCTPWASKVVGVVPGKGVIVTQAASNREARVRGEALIEQGASAKEVIAAISSASFDPSHARQQHGVVVLSSGDSSAGYTGAATAPFTGDVQAENVSVQGNILAGPDVVPAALEAFLKAGRELRSSLADRLLVALEAGSAKGGDRRCGKQTATSAYLVVARPGDSPNTPSLRIVAPLQYVGGKNAVEELRQEYDAMRSR